MASSVIGALRVVLGADTAIWEKNLKQANRGLAGFAKSAKVHAAAATAAFAAAAAAFGAAVNKVAKDTAALADLAESIGVPIERFSVLAGAARESGVQIEQLARAFRNVARNAQGAARAPTDFSRSLDALGVAWRDANGQFVRADELLIRVADKFASMRDGAGKTALAMKIFGEEMGPKLLPFLNLGQRGIEDLTQKHQDLSKVTSLQAAEARQLGGQLVTLEARFADLSRELGTRVIPFVNAVVAGLNRLIALLPKFDNFDPDFATLTDVNRRMAQLEQELQKASAELERLEKLGAGAFGNNLPKIEAMREKVRGLTLELALLRNEQARLAAEGAAGGKDDKKDPPIVRSATAARDALKAASAELVRLRELQALGVDLAPWEEQRLAIERVNKAFREGIISVQDHARAMQVAAATAQTAWLGALGEISSTLSAAFTGNKALAAATALINTAQGVTKALAQGGMFGWAQAAAIAAAGAAQVATIRSTNPGGGSARAAPVGGAAGGSAEGAAQQLFVQGLASDQLFSGDRVRDLISTLIGKQNDGFQVMVAGE